MAHPHTTPTTSTRAMAFVGLAGAALLLQAGPAAAFGVEVPVDAIPACPAEATADTLLDDICDVIDEAAGDLVDAVVESVAPVTDVVPVPEAVPALDGEEAPEEAPANEAPAPVQGGSTEAAPAAESPSEPAKVGAAGSSTTEVTEPQAPASDGRVAGSPTIQPANLGTNIPSIRSQNGLTLQPYEAPMVSIPMEYEAPMIATPPVTTAAPIQQAAADAVRFTGSALVPYTSGAGAWITATGLGLLGAAGYGLRRRADSLTATTLAELDSDA